MLLAQALNESGEATRHVYFPTAGFISLVAQIATHPGLEVGMVGREGMLGAQVALGVGRAPLRALVQGSGGAWRISVDDFRRTLTRSKALQDSLNRYVYVLMTQLANGAVCQRFHQVGERLARWLLMSQDRAHSDSFFVTHEFLALMLGVRRVGITAAAGTLRNGGLISYRRGAVTVLNRSGLESAACRCYAADRQTYMAQLGGKVRRAAR